MELYFQIDEKAKDSTRRDESTPQPQPPQPPQPQQSLSNGGNDNDEETLGTRKKNDEAHDSSTDRKQQDQDAKDGNNKSTSTSTELNDLNEKKQIEPTPPTADQPISIPIPMQEMKMQQRVQPNKEKYKILFVAVGSAPMLKKNKFMLPGKEEFHTLQARLKRMLKLPTSSNLYLYINQSFIPSPEDLIGDLGDLFCVGEELQIHYSLQEAFL